MEMRIRAGLISVVLLAPHACSCPRGCMVITRQMPPLGHRQGATGPQLSSGLPRRRKDNMHQDSAEAFPGKSMLTYDGLAQNAGAPRSWPTALPDHQAAP